MSESEKYAMTEEALVSDLTNRVSILFSSDADLVLAIIRAHLYTEFLIEHIIENNLPMGERISKNGRFTYSHKLTVVSSLGLVPDEVIASLRKFNKIRNDCAHEIEHKITQEMLDSFRAPLGNLKKVFDQADHVFDLKLKFGRTVVYICGYLAAAAYPSVVNKNF